MPQHNEALPEQLVRHGVELLERDGMAAVSLRAITRATGVSHGAPRRYFPTHNALLAAIARVGLTDLAAELNPDLSLTEVAEKYVDFARRRPAMFELMFRHDILDGAGADLRSISLPLFASFARGLPSPTAAVALWSAIHGVAVLSANRSFDLVATDTDRTAVIAAIVAAHAGGDRTPDRAGEFVAAESDPFQP